MTIALVMMGPPGSGKSSLGLAAAELLKLPLISSGIIAREMEQQDAYTRSELNKGEWAPEAAIRNEIKAQIEAAAISPGAFVIEGFPRRLEQLYILESVPGIRPIYFVLAVDPLQCLRRLILRARKDDHPDAVATRWRKYEEFTLPVIGMLMDWFIPLNGSETPEVLLETVTDCYRREQER